MPLSLRSNSAISALPILSGGTNIQRTLGANLILEIGYAGSHGLHMMRTQDVNQPLPNVGIANKTLNANQYRPYAGFGIISNREQSYASKYNGLQVELSRRFSHGILFRADYTWSKALDTTDCCSGNIYNWYANTQNASTEWGRSSWDAEHNFIANFVWEVPFLRNRTDLAGRVLGVAVLRITTFRSGLPIDPVLGIDQAGIGYVATTATGYDQSVLGLEPQSRRVVQSAGFVVLLSVPSQPHRNFISRPGTNNGTCRCTRPSSCTNGPICSSEQMRSIRNHTEFDTVGLTYSTKHLLKVTAARTPGTSC